MTVFAGARRPEALEALCEGNPLIVPVRVDVTDRSSLEAAREQILAQCDGVDILVCNAGVSRIGPIVEMSLANAQAMIDTNVTGVVSTVQVFAPAMIERRSGCIAVTGSVTSTLPSPWAGVYCTTKAAVAMLCRTLRLELEPFNVRVCHLYTGAVTSAISTNSSRHSGIDRFDDPRALYSMFSRAIRRRSIISQSQDAGSIPARAYARRVVPQLLRKGGARREIVAGGKALYLRVATMFAPERFVERKVRKLFMTKNDA